MTRFVVDNSDYPFDSFLDRAVRRARSTKAGARDALRGRRHGPYSFGGPHFKFDFEGRSYVYCYIRKNGCSAFKNFLINEYCNVLEGESEILSLTRTLGAHSPAQIADTEVRIAVLRDPVDRCCSLFRNKFIQRDGARDIFINFYNFTGMLPEEATFLRFVENFITAAFSFTGCIKKKRWRIDPHCLPQTQYFWPIHYTHVFLLSNLSLLSKELFGEEIRKKYFEKLVNSSKFSPLGMQASEIKASKLTELFREHGRMPSNDELLSPELRNYIEQVYKMDFKAIANFGTHATNDILDYRI